MTDLDGTADKLLLIHCRTVLAETLALDGRTAESLDILDELRWSNPAVRSGFLGSELQRLRGEALLALDPGNRPEAEAALRAALDIAARQQAMFLQLRAAVSLASLWQARGKRREAHDLLAPIHARFTEGLGTLHLVSARGLLAELEGRP